jgi:AraC-like DNA-binding protein
MSYFYLEFLSLLRDINNNNNKKYALRSDARLKGINMISDIYFRLLLHIINSDPSITEQPLSPKDLCFEGEYIATKYFSYLIDFIYKHNIDSNMGFIYGKDVVALNLCDFFKMITTAETVEECLEATVKIYHIFGLKPYPVIFKGQKVSSLAIAFPYEHSNCEYVRRFTCEVFFSYGLDLFKKSVSKNAKPIRIFLDYPKPIYSKHYEILFDCEIIYNSPVALIEFPSSMLHASLPSHNKPLHNIYMEKAFEQWSDTKRSQSFRYRAITQLMSQSPYNFNSSNLASAMSISTRGLQKRLAAEGSSYSQVSKLARRELVKICLFQKGMDFEETAKILGFQTQVSFRKFFKDQFGDSPKAYLLSKPEQLEPA